MAAPVLALLDDLSAAVSRQAQLAIGSGYEMLACASLGDLWSAARRMPGSVAVVDSDRIGGLLTEEHRHDLSLIDRMVPLVLLFDERCGQHMSAEDLGVTGVLDTPVEDQALLQAIAVARSKRLSQATRPEK